MRLMDKSERGYLYKYARKNYWRVASWMDFDDFIQTGCLAYYETRKRYPDAIDPKHIMALYKLVLRTHIENIVRVKSRQPDMVEAPGRIENLVSVSDTIVLSDLLRKAPSPIKEALLLFTDENKRAQLAKPYSRSKGQRETLNQRICSLLGLDHKCTDVVGEMRAYFGS